jgi:hypothetical protein
MKRYVCDGHHDCKGGEDESEGECGMYVICFMFCAVSEFFKVTDKLIID